MATRSRTLDRAPPIQARLTVEIKNTKLVELMDLTRSLSSLADEFQRHIVREEPEAAASEVTLYVSEIRAGSIVAEIVAISPQLLQGVSYVNAVIGFSGHLKKAYDYLTGQTDEKPPLEKTSYQNLANLVEPIAKDHGAQLNIGNVNGPVYYITLNSTQANAAQNTARKELDQLKEPASKYHEKVVLYWYQARADTGTHAGDRGIVESIASHPVKVVFVNDQIKLKMMYDQENPFKEAFVVDLMVETIGGKPVVYRVLALHEKFDKDEAIGQ